MFTHKEMMNSVSGLRKFAYKLTKNDSDADDLLQATLLRSLEKKYLYEPGTSFFKWASKIMFNIFASGYRRKTKFETQYDPEIYTDKLSFDAEYETKMTLKEVGRAFKKLSNEHKEIIDLVCVKGMQYNDAADRLRVPVGTVRSRLFRAREHLKMIADPQLVAA